MSRNTVNAGVSAALAAAALLGLAACSDPGASAASAANPTATTGVKQFNLSPQQDRVKVTVDTAAAALVPDAANWLISVVVCTSKNRMSVNGMPRLIFSYR